MKAMFCPVCDGKAILETKINVRKFRGEEFNLIEHFFKCAKCKEEFTTTDVDQLSTVQIYNQYREKHHIPFPEQIKAIREKYELSAIKMSEVLGFGVNTYRNYENGEIPSAANGKLIQLAENPENFKSLLESNGNTLKPKEFEHVIKIIESLLDGKTDFALTESLNFQNNIPNEYTGYKMPSIEKIKNLILFFLKHISRDYADKIKLNKLFFYSDFYYYKTHGYSITGLEYRAIPYGPVPSNYDFIYSNLQQLSAIESKFEKTDNGGAIQFFEPASMYDEQVFSENEMEAIVLITNQFKDMPSWDLVNLSHNEKAWIELNEQKEIISYQKYGFDLAGIKKIK